MILEARLANLFTRNFEVFQGAEEVGATVLQGSGESGSIRARDKEFRVERQGSMSREWRLIAADGAEVAVARMPYLFTRFTVIEWSGAESIVLQRAHPWTRKMIVKAERGVIGTVSPLHPFTRTARLEFPDKVPLEVRLFCLWLAAMHWRRSAKRRQKKKGS